MEITTKMIMGKNPCVDWPEEKVLKTIGKGKTLLELANLKISISDRIWVITRFLTDNQNRKFAIWCARSCKSKIPEINNYIDIIEKYYEGLATIEELRSAARAAYRAADRATDRATDWAADWAAYRAADCAAYCAADWAADRSAYSAADRAADRAAYRGADWVADMAAMRKKQIEKLKDIIKEGEI
jgi:3-keto-L-gulonate-6-phosphate decarboxylase